MKVKLAWYWVAALILVPLLVVAGLVLWRPGNFVLPFGHEAAAADGAYKVVVDRQPVVYPWPREKVTEVPTAPAQFDSWKVYLMHKDLQGLDLSGSGSVLNDWATFDNRTVWPEKMPPEFKPDVLLDLGKNPGLGVRSLHQQGVTGKGVRVAILDQTLLRNHEEIQGRIRQYIEVGEVAQSPEMHGVAVASLLVGKTVGVAPEADVDYVATQFVLDWNLSTRTFKPMAYAINRILDENQKRPPADRVRVISASIGAGPKEDGYAELQKAYQRAMKEGVLVVTTDMSGHYPYGIMGLNRLPYANPDDVNSYRPGGFWAASYYKGQIPFMDRTIYAPMDARTVANFTAKDDYRFDRYGGLSWSVPWAAGVYALACQVNPNVTPEQFLKAAYETGDYVTFSQEGKEYKLGPIMNPAAILARIKPNS